MRYVEVDGLRVSVVGLGTWQFGTREWGYGHEYAHQVAPDLVHRATAMGITLVDTAESYGPRTSEHIVGEAVLTLEAQARASLTIATKFTPLAPTEAIVRRQVEGSARRLGVRAIDLLYAHWPNPFVSVRRTMQSLRPLVVEGLIRRAAVSNYSLSQWQEAERALRHPVYADQVPFSLVKPRPAAGPRAVRSGECHPLLRLPAWLLGCLPAPWAWLSSLVPAGRCDRPAGVT